MEPRDWVTLVGVLATATISCVTILVSHSREQRQQERDDLLRAEARTREEESQNRERTVVPRVRTDFECRFIGPHDGRYLTEVKITVDNIGKRRRAFNHIVIKLRGIKVGNPLTRWNERDPGRTKFPEALLKTDMVKGVDYYFVEPGVKQTFIYITDIPQDIGFVLAYIELIPRKGEGENVSGIVFTEERVYAIQAT